MDSLLGQRSHQEHEATTAIKTEFMQARALGGLHPAGLGRAGRALSLPVHPQGRPLQTCAPLCMHRLAGRCTLPPPLIDWLRARLPAPPLAQLWEGFETTGRSNILVLGATNKKDRLDDAVLRRFSLQYEVRRRRDGWLCVGVGVGGCAHAEAAAGCGTWRRLHRRKQLQRDGQRRRGLTPLRPPPPRRRSSCRM